MIIAVRNMSIPLMMLVLLALAGQSIAQGPPKPPPAKVVVGGVGSGVIAPETEFVGTVYYEEVSEVAAEVSGAVKEVLIDDGRRVKKGEALVRLDTELLEKSIDSTRATYGQARADLARAKRDFMRVKALFDRKLASEQVYDDSRFSLLALSKKADSLNAQLAGLEVELGKKTVYAPFDGVVVKKLVERGEWVQPGGEVATMATDATVDVVVDVPEQVMNSVHPGDVVRVTAAGTRLEGTVYTVVPRGNVQTRTFPVKIKLKNTASLIEGMEARVLLPRGETEKAFILSRDALITKFGQMVVFVVDGAKVKMLPVNVVGYSGDNAGVLSPGLKDGMQVVIKGNERLNDGQPVQVTGHQAE